MTNMINLNDLNMIHFTIQDAEFYCKIFNINCNNIKYLFLNNNKLEDIPGVSIFKNLKVLILSKNDITDLSDLKTLINLEYLYINNLNLTDELKAVKILKKLPNLKGLYCKNAFKIIDIINELKGIKIYD